jgi:ectoine hydroxylase
MMDQLNDAQRRTYDEEGFLLLPNLFSASEIAGMKAQLPGLFAEDSPRRVLERDGKTVRSVYGSHLTNELFARLVREPRLLCPAMQMLGSDVYLYQFKINAKIAFAGDVWEWHQDYVFWRNEDGMPTSRVTSAVIFVDEVNEFNGPLLLIPRSHKHGTLEPLVSDVPAEYRDKPSWISNLTADIKYSLDQSTVGELVRQYGIVSPKGPAGSVLFFHGNLAHGSAPNMSPFDRALVLLTYNSMENQLLPIDRPPRPEFIVTHHAQALAPLAAHEALM